VTDGKGAGGGVSARPSAEELLAKARKPGEESIRMHARYRGKIETGLRCPVRSYEDFSIWYSPGVAAPCLEIRDEPEKVYDYTCKWNTIAVVSDGTRVLGLGDIGPKAGLPVMEGKALLFKYLGGVDCVPIMLDTKDPEASTWRTSRSPSASASWIPFGCRRRSRSGTTTSRGRPRSSWPAC
jgi:malic enzyme